jgi:outer membrane protein assembly factor BamD
MRLLIRWLGIIALATAMVGCSTFGKEVDKTRDWSAQRLYSEAKRARSDGDYETAIDYYEKLESRYPFGRYAQQAQIEVAYAYYKFNEPASAIAAADRFLKLHPRHPNADYAYYIKGLTNFNQGKGIVDRFLPIDSSQRDPGAALQAFQDFSELVKRYPESKYTPDARQRMVYLRNNLAKHEVHVAGYYFRRQAYVAAVNRAKHVIENYQRTPSVPDALAIMVRGYTILELNDLAADALRVLKLNYPDHPDIEDVEKLVVHN